MNQYFCWFIDIFAHAIVAGCTQKRIKIKDMTKINGGLNNGGNTIKRTEF